MVTPADVSGSRLLPRYRASHIAKRLPSKCWAMVTPADVPGSRLLPRCRAGHIAKRLPFRRWATRHLQTFLIDDEDENECRRGLYFPGASCDSNSSNRGSIRSGSHKGDFFSWP